MKKVISVFLAAVMCLSSIVLVNAEQQTGIVDEESSYDVVFAEEFDSGAEQMGTFDAAEGVFTDNSDGTATISGSTYRYKGFENMGTDWTAHIRFKYTAGGFNWYIVGDDLSVRAKLCVADNGVYTDISTGATTGQHALIDSYTHEAGKWYEYKMRVRGFEAAFYRKAEGDTDFVLCAKAVLINFNTATYNNWKNQSPGMWLLPENGLTVDFMRVYANRYSDTELIGSDKELVWTDDFSSDGGTKVFDGSTNLSKGIIPADNGFTCKFGLTWKAQTQIYIWGCGERWFIQLKPDAIYGNSFNGADYESNIAHENGVYYEYIIDVDDAGNASYYRKAQGEEKYTLVLATLVQSFKSGTQYVGKRFDITPNSSETEYDYFSVYSKTADRAYTNIYSEEWYDSDMDEDGQYVANGTAKDFDIGVTTSGSYVIHTRVKVTDDSTMAELQFGLGDERIDLKVGKSNLGVVIPNGAASAYSGPALSHEKNVWYDYCVDVSKKNNTVTYYRMKDGDTSYEPVVKIDKNTHASSISGMRIGGKGVVDFVRVYSYDALTSNDILANYRTTVFSESNISVPAAVAETTGEGDTATTTKTEGVYTAAAGLHTYPYAIHVKFTKNDGDVRLAYVDATMRRVKFEAYASGIGTNGGLLAGIGMSEGEEGEFILVADGTRVDIYKLGENGLEWCRQDASMPVVSSGVKGLRLQNASTSGTADFDFVRIYSLTTQDVLNIRNLAATAGDNSVTGSADVLYGTFDTSKSASFTMIVVVYDENGALKAVKPAVKTVNGGFENGGLTNVIETLDGITLEEGDTYKVFAWDSLNNMMPY